MGSGSGPGSWHRRDEAEAPADAKTHGGARFVNDTKRILELLAERHGFPRLHG